MIKNQTIVTVSILTMIAAVLWAVAVTVVCVKQDRQLQVLQEQCDYYKERYNTCLQGKLPFRDISSTK